MPKLDDEFYTVEYEFMGEQKFACYFQLESAQEAMMKMIKKGMVVKGLETKSLRK
jgi:hypothetical protein